mgnify:CR=1 FL=1
MTQRLDGLTLGGTLQRTLREEVAVLRSRGILPVLAEIMISGNHASGKYASQSMRACENIGAESWICRLPKDSTPETLSSEIFGLSVHPHVNGVLIQLPLENLAISPPQALREITYRSMDEIIPSRDVDGFHPTNITKFVRGQPCLPPATAKGIITLLDHYGIPLKGRDVAIIGVSEIVGRPLGNFLVNQREATVAFCHRETRDISFYMRNADIVVSAIGKPHYFNADVIKEGAVVIDVGMNRVIDPTSSKGYRFVGDFDDSIWGKASHATPVPGGVGPMTVATLMQNLVQATKNQNPN